MESTLQLGAFRLIRPVGIGGMGMVWRATHQTQDHPVAIKVMTAKRARQKRFSNAFLQEVRAVARLNHPNIIRLFDSGEIDERAERLTDGRLIAGSPYLVMELAGSTLAHVNHDKLSWSHVRTILMHVLDALAHSHARGLVHRDLKPDNILFLADGENSKLKLSDFGLAHAINTSRHLKAEDEAISGTPRYMAPEQITGRVRDQGPWTDLYALGCLAYCLTGGSPPFSADTVDEVLRSHLTKARPPLEPRLDVPEGFDRWAERLLARKPEQRFRRAADAACELAKLDGEAPVKKMTLVAHTDGGDSMDMTIVDDDQATHILDDTLALLEAETSGFAEGNSSSALPQLPESWRHAQPPPDSLKMVGVGLGLYGLREIPLVAREGDRDRLWEAVTDTRYTRRPHAVILSGSAGIGKTRLARWLGRRTHEVGATNVLEASHSPISGPAHGLSRMFANFLDCTGLPREQILERVREFYSRSAPLDGDELHQCVALTELLAPGADPHYDDEQTRLRFNSPKEKYVVWKRLLQKLGQHRPLLLVLDDVHWGSDTLQFVRYLFEECTDDDLPLLIVMTSRRDLLDDYPLADNLLEEIGQSPFSRRLELGPLTSCEHNELIHNLLGLESKLAQQVAQRTAGNPLFAIQLVGDWVERGILELSDQGFRLPEGEQAPLPEDVHHLLVQRLEKLVGQCIDDPPQTELLVLELAATLGRKVNYREWNHLCEKADLSIPADLLDAMAARSLARPEDQGWTFVHGALRETLERIAAEHRRLPDHHRLCAQMLADLYDASGDALAPRLAHHLVAAGELEAALAPLMGGLQHYSVTCEFEAAQSFFDLYEATRQQLDIGDDDRRTIQGWLAHAKTCLREIRVDEADALLHASEQCCRRHGWTTLLAKTLLDRSTTCRLRGQVDRGLTHAEEALALYQEQEDNEGIAHSLLELGWLHKWRGELPQAQRLVVMAEQRFRTLGDDHERARCLHCLASIFTSLGNYSQATEFVTRARKLFAEVGDLKGVSHCFTSLGENYRHRGHLAQAEQAYLHALETGNRIGISRDLVYCFNLGATLLEQHKFSEAMPFMEESLRRAMYSERPGYLALAHAGMLACNAGLGQWTHFDKHLQKIEKNLDNCSFIERDLALITEQAADYAHHSGHLDRACRTYEIAVSQWRSLGNEERTTFVEARLVPLRSATDVKS